jgi:transcriptional regulator with XRE-family HTH domain
MEDGTRHIGSVIGLRVRKLREDRAMTQVELLSELRRVGVRWPRSRLVPFEQGSVRDISLTELLSLGAVLQVGITDLIHGHGRVLLGEGASIDLESVRRYLADKPPHRLGIAHPEGRSSPAPGADPWGMSFEQELAQEFDVPEREIGYSADRVFGRSATAERDRLLAAIGDVPKPERTARRGHATKTVKNRIEADLIERNKVDR